MAKLTIEFDSSTLCTKILVDGQQVGYVEEIEFVANIDNRLPQINVKFPPELVSYGFHGKYCQRNKDAFKPILDASHRKILPFGTVLRPWHKQWWDQKFEEWTCP